MTQSQKSHSRKKFLIRAVDFCLALGEETKIMAILNLTPDSFSRDGLLPQIKKNPGRILNIVERLIRQGADIIDIGGESTRPGARPVAAQEEISRIIPAVQFLAKKIKIPISVDTYKPLVAQRALDAGAVIVNNILGNRPNPALLRMIHRYRAAVVLMHIRGTPAVMQKNIRYRNLIPEITAELAKSIENCLDMGMNSDKIIIDPGLGFGKTVGHNLELINHLEKFKILKRPILIGPSRKFFIGHILGKEVDRRLMGTAAAVSASILHGAHVVRVHDVAQMHDVAVMSDAILNPNRIQPQSRFSK